MFLALNRSAVVVTPREPFVAWVRGLDEDSQDITAAEICQPALYLLPECEDDDRLLALLRKAGKRIFEEQLEAWCQDPSSWPIDRSFDVFQQWFEFHQFTLILDTCRKPLKRD